MPSKMHAHRKPGPTSNSVPLDLFSLSLAASFFLIGISALSASPAWAGCNTGNSPNTDLLNTSDCQADASGEGALAVGSLATADGRISIAFGGFSDAVGVASISLGNLSGSDGISGIAVGHRADATGDYSVAIGAGEPAAFGGFNGPKANGQMSVAIGSRAVANGRNTIVVGDLAGSGSATGSAFNSFFGAESGVNADGVGNTALGLAAGHDIDGDANTAVGNSAAQVVNGSDNIAIGILSGGKVTGSYNLVVGDRAGGTVKGNSNIAIGRNAGNTVTGGNSISIGTGARGRASNAVAIGFSAQATVAGAIAIGQSSLANAANTVSVGSTSLRRRIVNVAPAVAANDAVTLGQVRSLIAAASLSSASASQPPSSRLSSYSASESIAATAPSGVADGNAESHVTTDAGSGQPIVVAWANVGNDGSLTKHRNTAHMLRSAPGRYQFTFAKGSTSVCSYNASLSEIGFVTIKPGDEENEINVETLNIQGVPFDTAFYLMKVC